MDPSIQCQICGVIAKGSLKHYRHYNTICCLGCKAFFRRYIRGINQTNLECKGGGNCDLTIGRTACKDCRYKKCLKVGMDPSKVLGEEDRKRYTHQRKRPKPQDNEVIEEVTLDEGPSRRGSKSEVIEEVTIGDPETVDLTSSQAPVDLTSAQGPEETIPSMNPINQMFFEPGMSTSYRAQVPEEPSTPINPMNQMYFGGPSPLESTLPRIQVPEQPQFPIIFDSRVPGALSHSTLPRYILPSEPGPSAISLPQRSGFTSNIPQTGLLGLPPKVSSMPMLVDLTRQQGILPNLPPLQSHRKITSPPKKMFRPQVENSVTTSLKSMSHRIQEVQNTFYEVYAKVHHNQILIDHLIAGHLSVDSWSSTHSSAFMELVNINVPFMYHFASKQKNFNTLEKKDQKLLLGQNAKLFREYVIARYLVAETGIDQLAWALGPNEPLGLGIFEVKELSPVAFDQLNRDLGMIQIHGNPVPRKSYKRSLSYIREYFNYPKYHSPLIANLFLYSTYHWKPKELNKLTDINRVKLLEDEAREMIQFGSAEIGDEIGTAYLNQLTETLHTMYNLKHKRGSMEDFIIESQYSILSEKNWVQNLVDTYFEINMSNSADALWVEALTAFQLYGIYHLADKMFFEGFNLCKMRCVAFLKNVCGINEPKISQNTLDYAVQITGIKSETYKKFAGKVKFLSGISDIGEEFEEKFSNTPNPLSVDNPSFRAFLDPFRINKARRLHLSIRHFLNHDDLFVLVLLTTLLESQENYQDWYLCVKRMLMKRIQDLCVIEGCKNAKSIYDEFSQDVIDLSEISTRMSEEAGNRPSSTSTE